MPSSSAYAAPIDLDMRPGRWEQGGRAVAGLLAVGALALTDVPPLSAFLCAWIALLILVRDDAQAARRPARIRLHASGDIECAAAQRREPAPDRHFSVARASAQGESGASRAQLLTGDDSMVPAALLQASTFFGLTQLHWAAADDRPYACILFPDRLDRVTAHRLRTWLATHRPENSTGVLLPGSMPR